MRDSKMTKDHSVLGFFPEPFLESVPQCFIMQAIWDIETAPPGSSCSVLEDFPLFLTTYATSVIAASLGISKFLKSGPCNIIRNDSYLKGYGTLSYFLLLINIIVTLISKGIVFPFYLHQDNDFYVNIQGMAIMTLNFIPQFIHVSSHCFLLSSFEMLNFQALVTIYLALGIPKATSTIIIFPAIVLTPAFSFWTFGPVSSTFCCIYKKKEPNIHLSYRFTWINALFTSCMTGGLLMYVQLGVQLKENYGPRIDGTSMFYGSCALVLFPLVSLLLIHCLGKCACLCNENCFPMKPKVIYDTRTGEKC